MRLLIIPIILASISGNRLLASDGLTKTEIQKVVIVNQESVNACYALATKGNAPKNGKIRMEIKVGRTGQVEFVKTADNSFHDRILADCLEGKIRQWSFPAPLAKQPSTFSYPFVFGASSNKVSSTPEIDERMYRGRLFKKSNRPIEDIEVLQKMARNKAIKAKVQNCEDVPALKAKCEDLEPKDRIVCSAMTNSAPKVPFTPDWLMIDHPDAFRIENNIYFIGYWHISCEALLKS